MKKIIIITIIGILVLSLGVFFFLNKKKVLNTQEIDIYGNKYNIPVTYKYINTTEKYDDGSEDNFISLYTRERKNVDIYIRKFDINNMLNEESGRTFEEVLFNRGYHYDQIDDKWNDKFIGITVLKFFYRENKDSDYLNTLLSYVPINENDYYEIIVRNYNNKFDYETMKEITDILLKNKQKNS